MAVTVVVWNVQTFGDARPAARGANYAPICRFMAQALYEVSADVLIMMELRRGGAQYLPTLQAALMAQSGAAADVWDYDYIPGSVTTRGYPNDPDDLDFTQTGHSEGYAVLWRDNHPEFTVLDTPDALSHNIVNGQSKIGLVLEGRSAQPNVPNPYWFAAPNFVPPPPPWRRLEFPEPNPIHAGDTRWNLCRRPCCVVLDLNRPGAGVPREQELLPIVVHHATNNPRRSTPWSVQSAAYSAQLYQVDDTTQAAPTMVDVAQALAAGDFNIDRNVDAEAYGYFTRGFTAGGANNGGANLPTTWADSANAPDNHTAIRLSRWRGPHQPPVPITDANVDAYRWLAIDNLFIRNLATVNPPANYHGPVYNILSGLLHHGFLVNPLAKRAAIRAFRTAILTALGPPLVGGGYTNYPFIDPANNTPCRTRRRKRGGGFSYYSPVISNLRNFTYYMADLQRGYFRTPRRAAEFYVNSISDHLPLVYRFTV
ncbi:hypothetical protein [Streptomyces sp. DSM 15324]|uniref:hypothetical protein n=1 Tax=Streptomyces sp. DSM 15324 TaxID=1739111 RepID=UPI000745FB49|nr:hypothetical protein [Streptomyces sp. DSM 15324]KUO09302.1 hypothetical protein AQJ58_25180 [Streptomyces sp. DSM 15324]